MAEMSLCKFAESDGNLMLEHFVSSANRSVSEVMVDH